MNVYLVYLPHSVVFIPTDTVLVAVFQHVRDDASVTAAGRRHRAAGGVPESCRIQK